MTRDLVRKKQIEAELRAAIQRDELSIFFQPIVDLETGRIRTFEALVRWFHPEKGELRPDEFIPVAEETGVIITLGNWITAQAAKAAAGWPEDVTIAVNLSPVQIRAPGAALGILNALKEAGLDPHRLELEVTESLFLDDDENTARFIDDLAAEGVRFALDDFGTGYSSLGYINKFPFKQDQGRPQLRLGPERRQEERRDHPRGGRDGRDARHGHRRRRARDDRAGARGARRRLHARPGLLLQPRGARLPRGDAAVAGTRPRHARPGWRAERCTRQSQAKVSATARRAGAGIARRTQLSLLRTD